jgi:hypothetical protein
VTSFFADLQVMKRNLRPCSLFTPDSGHDRADQKLAKYILYLTIANGLLAMVSICVALAAFLAK